MGSATSGPGLPLPGPPWLATLPTMTFFLCMNQAVVGGMHTVFQATLLIQQPIFYRARNAGNVCFSGQTELFSEIRKWRPSTNEFPITAAEPHGNHRQLVLFKPPVATGRAWSR